MNFPTSFNMPMSALTRRSRVERHEPLYRRIYEDLAQQIIHGELQSGQQIETEPQLAERYGVSIGTVRQAQELLIQERLLIKQQGRGCFVAPDGTASCRVLWVCGVDLLGGDISPYYTLSLALGVEACRTQSLSFESAWLCNERPEEVESYCQMGSARQYMGYIFVGCGEDHPLLLFARKHDLHHVHVGWEPRKTSHLVIDFADAMRQAAAFAVGRGHQQLTAMCLQSSTEAIRRAGDQSNLDVRVIEAPLCFRASDYERLGYERGKRLLADGGRKGCLLITDDILARGVTRAILEYGAANSPFSDVVVFCARQQAIPLGLPITFLVHDPRAMAHSAIDLLQDQARGGTMPAVTFTCEMISDVDVISTNPLPQWE